jgi:hypothetical protein
MRFFLAALLAAHLICLSCPQQAAAQFGGRSGGDRGGSSDDRAQRMREMMERFRGGDRGGSSDDRAQRMREMMERFRGGEGGSRFGGGSREGGSRTTGSREGSRSRGSKSKEPQRRKKIRVTLDLPEDYLDGDRDRDGQIGLYEWKEWKSRSAISAFFRLDRNRDGFLTPRELVYAQADNDDSDSDDSDSDDSDSDDSDNDDSDSDSDDSSSSKDTSDTASSKTDGGKGGATSSAASSASGKLALRYWPLLDRDKSGNIEGKEWDRSKRLRPMFEKAGADLSKPMSKDEFVAMYIKASAKK